MKPYYFTHHAINRLSEFGLTEAQGQEMILMSKYKEMPTKRTDYKYSKYGLNQENVYYMIYKWRTDFKTEFVLFTVRELEDRVIVITATKK